MKKLKTQKGITLIALIITIVVLLILAVVAIGSAQESNIVGYAQNAATKYEQAQNNEVDTLSMYENKIEGIILDLESKTRIYNVNIPSNDYYLILMKNGTAHMFMNGTNVKTGNYEIKSGTIYTTSGINLGTYKDVLYIDGEIGQVRFSADGLKVYGLLDATGSTDGNGNSTGSYVWTEGYLDTEKTLEDFGLSE